MTIEILEVEKMHLQNILKERTDEALKIPMQTFKINYTYDAISLEGHNRMPYEDVKRLIELKRLLNYSEREQKEVLNHVRAFEKVLDLVVKKSKLTEEHVKDIHEILVDGIFQGGVYRNVNIQMMGSKHQPTDHAKVYDRMHKLFESIANSNKLSAIDKAIEMHAGISKIHPFLDANGRLARLILNFYLLEANYLPLSIHVNDKLDYIKHLETFKENKNIQPLKVFIISNLVKRYEEVIEQLEITSKNV
jgi:Fic family protein